MPQSIEEIKEEKQYWSVIETYLGWRLYGWTYKYHASFERKGVSVSLTGTMRDDIVEAIKEAAWNG